MDSNFERSLTCLLESEGKYSDNKYDPGGETMMGVTKAAWETWTKKPVLPGEMAKLTKDDIRPFYKDIYWDGAKCPQLPLGLDYMLFDSSVNMGVGQATRLLQKALGCVTDGVIGPNVMQRITNTQPQTLINLFSTEKEYFYKSLKTFSIFGEGWINRINKVKRNAEEMIND